MFLLTGFAKYYDQEWMKIIGIAAFARTEMGPKLLNAPCVMLEKELLPGTAESVALYLFAFALCIF